MSATCDFFATGRQRSRLQQHERGLASPKHRVRPMSDTFLLLEPYEEREHG